jgi:hypothetical protein
MTGLRTGIRYGWLISGNDSAVPTRLTASLPLGAGTEYLSAMG